MLEDQALAFFRAMLDHGAPGADTSWYAQRSAAVLAEIASTGTYVHTAAELTFGARLAWYHSNRCIARHLWRTLEVFDARHVTDHAGVVAHLERHMDHAFNRGRIRSAITVFAPRSKGPTGIGADRVRMGNHQLVRYAGFKGPHESVVGDPSSVAFTTHCIERGWEPVHHVRYTPLPWCIWIDGREMPPHDIFRLRPELLNEVKISHPEAPFFADLDLRWYAVPFLADMALVIGGVVYPCAPFNGFYMGTEIGARNLADADRYDMLPAIADGFGWDRSDERSMWRDRAMLELNRAVLHSFDAAGVRIGDHHALGSSFAAFCTAEEKKERKVTGDWTWLVPPVSGSLSPLFHRSFDDAVCSHTNFFLHAPPGQVVAEPEPVAACPYHLKQGR
ncbi:MAG: nitric oxide synthase oxygenase [Flavobacteriales bacterium]